MNPPPVTQQPPADGGTQSSEVLFGTHAPHALGWVPGAHVGGCVHIVSLSFDSQLNGGWPPPSSAAASGGLSLGGSPLSISVEASQSQDPPPCPGGPPCE